jgi:hypothetical protein
MGKRGFTSQFRLTSNPEKLLRDPLTLGYRMCQEKKAQRVQLFSQNAVRHDRQPESGVRQHSFESIYKLPMLVDYSFSLLRLLYPILV